VSGLAACAAVGPATLHRRFRAQLGTTPLMWLAGERLALACRLIERGSPASTWSRGAAGSVPLPICVRWCGAKPALLRRRTSAGSGPGWV